MGETVLLCGCNDLHNYACKDCKIPMCNALPAKSGLRFQCPRCHIVLFVCTKTQPHTKTWRPATAAPG